MIVNVRGTSGSGKTWLARRLLEHTAAVPFAFAEGKRKPKPEVYRGGVTLGRDGPEPIFILGSYETTCGGCDTIPTQDRICDLVRQYAPQGHVFLEGLLMSHLESRYTSLAYELGKERFVFAFLDTPIETCLARIQQRREARGRTGTPEPKHAASEWRQIKRVIGKFDAAGLRTVVLPWEDPWAPFVALF
jgi:hypothetical protein